MTGMDGRLHDKANGAFFPIVHGMELLRVQQRLLASLLRQPGLVPTVLTTGIGPENFPEELRHAFIVATREPGRARQIVADPTGDPKIRTLYMQIALLGHGQARQMAEQIIASIRRRDAIRRAGDHRPSGTNNLTDGDAEPEQQPSDVGANAEHAANGHGGIRVDDDRQSEHVGRSGNHGSQDAEDATESASKGAKESGRQRNYEPVSPDEPKPDHLIDADLIEMNQKYAVVRIGGKTRVVWFEEAAAYPGCRVPVFSTISDFCAFHAKRKKVVFGKDGKERKIGIGKWWINHEQRRQFSGLVYAPSVTAKITNGKLINTAMKEPNTEAITISADRDSRYRALKTPGVGEIL
jgi:hypothetical protein